MSELSIDLIWELNDKEFITGKVAIPSSRSSIEIIPVFHVLHQIWCSNFDHLYVLGKNWAR